MKSLNTLLGLGLAAAALVAQAGPTVEVARVKLVLAEPGWKSTAVDLGNIKLDSSRSSTGQGMFGSLEGHARVLTLRGADEKPVAAMLVYATYGAARNLRLEGSCPASERAYVRDFTGGRRESPECVQLYGVFDGSHLVKESQTRLAAAWSQNPFEVPDKALLLVGNFANSTGAIIYVEALISPALQGLAGRKPEAAVPAGLPEEIAAWADAFGDAARKALRSFSGELAMPVFEFY